MQATAGPNPIADLIPDAVYEVLDANHLLSEKGIRDYQIRLRFRNLREGDVAATDAIEQLREEYPYLQFDTLRKIVYRLNHK